MFTTVEVEESGQNVILLFFEMNKIKYTRQTFDPKNNPFSCILTIKILFRINIFLFNFVFLGLIIATDKITTFVSNTIHTVVNKLTNLFTTTATPSR